MLLVVTAVWNVSSTLLLVLSAARRNLTAACWRSVILSCTGWTFHGDYGISYELGVMTYACQHEIAPQYLADHCTPVSDVPARQRLRSASRHQLVVP